MRIDPSKCLRNNQGVVLILVALFLPILFFGVKCLVDKGKISLDEAQRSNIAITIAQTAQSVYNYEVAWKDQEQKIWNACAEAVKERYGKTIASNGLTLTLCTETKDKQRDGQWYIKCDCRFIKKNAIAYIEELNADIVIALPTTNTTSNRTTSHMWSMASKCYTFVSRLNFNRVAVGVIPYSGKISIPANRIDDWCKNIPSYSIPSFNETTFPTLKISDLYGSNGDSTKTLGAAYNWEAPYPIMYRDGSLTSVGDPTKDKFYKMNLQPCSSRNFSVLAGKSLQNSPEFSANPYPIQELTRGTSAAKQLFSQMQNKEITDQYNKSNFLFLPAMWTNYLLKQSWTTNPSHNTQSDVTKYAVLIANAPNKFASRELTYLGFNNDAAKFYAPETARLDIDSTNQWEDKNNGRINYYKILESIVDKNGNTLAYRGITTTFKGLITIKVKKNKVQNDPNARHYLQFLFLLPSNKSKLVTDKEYNLYKDETEFYVHPDQIDGSVKLELCNAYVSSIEVTNRKFTLREEEFTHSDNSITCTYQPQPCKVTVTATKDSPSITFKYSDGKEDKKILDWKGKKTFSFSYSNDYSDDYSSDHKQYITFTPCEKDKFTYTKYNCKTVSISAKNRCVRCAGTKSNKHQDDGVTISTQQQHAEGKKDDFISIASNKVRGQIEYDWGEYLPYGNIYIHYWDEGAVCAGSCHYCRFAGWCLLKNGTWKQVWNKKCKHAVNGDNHKGNFIAQAHKKFKLRENNANVYKGDIEVRYVVFKQQDDTVQSLSDNGTVSFVGGGDVTVTVTTDEAQPYFKIKKCNGRYDTITLTGPSIDKVISPADYKFDGNSVTITTTNAKITSVSKLSDAYYTYAEFDDNCNKYENCDYRYNNQLSYTPNDEDVRDAFAVTDGQFEVVNNNEIPNNANPFGNMRNRNKKLIGEKWQTITTQCSNALDKLTAEACMQLKGSVSKIYVINCGVNATGLNSCADKIYSTNLKDLGTVLNKISEDIKQLALKSGKIIVTEQEE